MKGKSTIDPCFVLRLPQNGRKELYAAFVDLIFAFDLIERGRLWQKLASTNTDRRLLSLVQQLHTHTPLRVRLGANGLLGMPLRTLSFQFLYK